MENKEDILDALEEFSNKRKHEDDIPAVLEKYLCRIAATGEPMFPWSKLKPLFLHKLNQVVRRFEERNTECAPPQPNVENAKVPELKDRLNRAIDSFNGIPFTIQRLCELVTNPDSHYKKTDKFIRGVEKNVMVVSTIDPFGNRITVEPKHVTNGLDANDSFEDSPTKLNVSLATPVNSPAISRVSARGDVGFPLGCVGAAIVPTAGGDAPSALPAESRLSESPPVETPADHNGDGVQSEDSESNAASATTARRNSGGFQPSISSADSTPCDSESTPRLECHEESTDDRVTPDDSSGETHVTTTEPTTTKCDTDTETGNGEPVDPPVENAVCDKPNSELPAEAESPETDSSSSSSSSSVKAEQSCEGNEPVVSATAAESSSPEASTPLPDTSPEVCASSDSNVLESSDNETKVSTSTSVAQETAMETE